MYNYFSNSNLTMITPLYPSSLVTLATNEFVLFPSTIFPLNIHSLTIYPSSGVATKVIVRLPFLPPDNIATLELLLHPSSQTRLFSTYLRTPGVPSIAIPLYLCPCPTKIGVNEQNLLLTDLVAFADLVRPAVQHSRQLVGQLVRRADAVPASGERLPDKPHRLVRGSTRAIQLHGPRRLRRYGRALHGQRVSHAARH